MISVETITRFVLAYIIYACIIQCSNSIYERQCHNYYIDSRDECESKSYNGKGPDGKLIKISCQICTHHDKKNTLTKCNTTQFLISIEDILSVVPDSVEYLLINLDNTWNGFLPLEPAAINISGISRLRHLRHFQISDNNYQYFQLFPLAFDLSDFDNLTKLQTLRIRIPVIDNQKYNISQMIEKLPHLEFLDLSYTRGLGIKTIQNIFEKLHNASIKYLCIRKFQLQGAKGYASDLSNLIWNNRKLNFRFEHIEELDISDNTIARMTPGITEVFPNLKAIDISGNSLLDGRNMALLLELLLHPQLELLNANYQGCEDQPSRYVPTSGPPYQLGRQNLSEILKISSGISTLENELIKYTEGPNEIYSKDPKDKLRQQQKRFLLNCTNFAGNGNISNIFNESIATCSFLKCILPFLFEELICEDTTFIPMASEIFNYTCMLYMNIPLGNNLKVIEFSHVHLEQARTIGVDFSGQLCVRVNNSIENVDINDNNIWIESAKLDKTISNLAGISNLNHLRRLKFTNNEAVIKLILNVTGNIPFLKYLNLTGNFLDIYEFCSLAPNVEILDFTRTNITYIHPEAISNCPKLKVLYIGYNHLNIDSLVNLDFNKTPHLKHLDLSGCKIHRLPPQFLQKLDECKNLTINLSENPLSCNCSTESKEFVLWMRKKAQSLVEYHHYICSGPHGLTFIYNINNTKSFWASCHSDNFRIAIISVTSTIGMTAFIAMVCLIYKVRWRLRYLFFRLQRKCNICFGKLDKEKHIWRYDAFVSYSAEDRFWVHDTFMKSLEETYGFRLCIHYRDFPVGGDIAETISERMSESREIIIIISDIAVRSEWCQFELDEALLQAHRRSKKLIVIKLGKVKSKLLNTKVAHILDNHTFLEWSENSKCQSKHKLFWNILVAKIYNDPYGECLCCCPYGARSLGYKDIIDPIDDDITIHNDEHEDFTDFPPEVLECRQKALSLKKKAKQAKNFSKTLESVLSDEDLPHWAYGPTPWPIEKLLEGDKEKFDDQVHKHATERIKLLIECLTKKQTVLNELHEELMVEFEKAKQQYIYGENL